MSLAGKGVLIVGPSGAGKSSLAAQLIVHGAGLICDDRLLLQREEGHVRMAAPPTAIAKLELRGMGLVPVSLCGPTPLSCILSLEASLGRLPPEETVTVFDQAIPLLRHPYSPDLAAKLFLWVRAGLPQT